MSKPFLMLGLLMFMVPAQANASSNNATCRLLAQHKLADSAAYKPGVDVDGNPVVPADLNTEPEAEPEIETEAGTETDSDTDTETETETEAESPVGVLGDLSKVAKIPLTVDIAERVAGLAGTGVELNAPLGMIEIHEDGTVKYNGEDWTKSMLTLCGLSHREATVKEVEDSKVEMPEPTTPKTPEVMETPDVMKPAMTKPEAPDDLVVEKAEKASMPAVSAPETKEVAPVEVSPPSEPAKPLVGTTKTETDLKTETQNETASDGDIIRGEDHRDHHE